MTDQPQPPSPGSDRRDPLSFDELIALIVAFSVIGVILWWGIGRKTENWLGQKFSTLTGDNKESTTLFGKSSANLSTDSAQPIPSAEGEVNPSPEESVALVPAVPQPQANTSTLGPVVGGVAVLVPAVVAPTVVAPTSPTTPASPEAASVPEPSVSPSIVVPSVAANAAPTFTDVPNDYWAYPFIAELSKRGIITGVANGKFEPDQPLNRAQYAALVSNVLPDNQQNQINFSDVSSDYWGSRAIDDSVQSGFIKGYLDNTFQPDQPISRMQVLLSLVNGFGFAKSANPDPALAVFQDQEQIPTWARPAIGTATQSGLVVSYPDTKVFNPQQPATRAEVAAMLYQALTASGKLEPIQSNYIVRP